MSSDMDNSHKNKQWPVDTIVFNAKNVKSYINEVIDLAWNYSKETLNNRSNKLYAFLRCDVLAVSEMLSWILFQAAYRFRALIK